eukprot:5708747-Alexandrium_andersonii.AAC.1
MINGRHPGNATLTLEQRHAGPPTTASPPAPSKTRPPLPASQAKPLTPPSRMLSRGERDCAAATSAEAHSRDDPEE